MTTGEAATCGKSVLHGRLLRCVVVVEMGLAAHFARNYIYLQLASFVFFS